MDNLMDDMDDEEWERRLVEVRCMDLDGDAAIAALYLSNDRAALKGLLKQACAHVQEVYDSIPGTYDETHPEVIRHGKALNELPKLLADLQKVVGNG